MGKKLLATFAAGSALLMSATPLLAAAETATEEKPGLLSVDIAQIAWVMGLFLILVIILYRTAWKNVLAGLNAREARIRGNIADAEASRAKAEAALKDYNTQLATAEGTVRELLGKAAADAEKIAAGIKMHAQQDAEEIKERAMKEIDSSRQQALTEIYAQTAELATMVAEKILRRSLNAEDQKDLVTESLKQLATIKSV